MCKGRKGNVSPRPKSTRFCGEVKSLGFAPPRPLSTSNCSNFAWSPANGTGLRVGTICLERIEVIGQHELAPSYHAVVSAAECARTRIWSAYRLFFPLKRRPHSDTNRAAPSLGARSPPALARPTPRPSLAARRVGPRSAARAPVVGWWSSRPSSLLLTTLPSRVRIKGLRLWTLHIKRAV